MTYLALVVGGVVGGVLRYAVDAWMPVHTFPLSTLCVNLLGAFALGLLYGLAQTRALRDWLRVGLGVGVIGSFTTFSTMMLDLAQWASGHVGWAALYTFVSMAGGPLLAFLAERAVLVLMRRPADVEELSA
ncbi:CrcB family protein [Alicyclobacillus cycloheptanicus]|uniref:Fluoride-specific ion channel FluC n=1 Tax=Alicyclobacillus cycloheptanicus TaxID=1457 RepID=A0ABT9XET8_9BACL|nr:CrcB family protein [Alicyclobacillus cycloheptanicus]MDQ0188815.1 CrcB protein [Alicyclobacillus cycloheptanicus]WDM00536.1 CrcB family protein [Alicyclobacillus cycloheptanicus]